MVIDCLNDIQLGCRVECSGDYGTVRYIGFVEGHPALWLGIDWDDATRGKHDGSVNGTRYFQASEPTSGSFIRPGKVQLGRNALAALTTRYGQREDDAQAQVNQLQLLNLQKEINAPFLTMVGFDKINLKQSKFHDLQVVSLRMQLVNSIGNEDLSKICPNLQELDLSKNLFHDWSTIFAICRQLNKLQWLNISENYLEMPKSSPDIRFPHITTLICGHMKLSWDDVLILLKIFCCIEKLRVPYNLISSVCLPVDCNLQLNLIDLEGNQICKWDNLLSLGTISTLEELNISNTAIQDIYFPCEWDEKTNLFVNLKKLVISDNQIDCWDSISELNKLQNLDDLRFLRNPVLEKETVATCIQLIVARIDKLSVLNGTRIKNDERKGAEYDYIKKHGLEWLSILKSSDGKEEFCKRHPRYLHLVQKHGVPEESELIVKPQSLKTSLIYIEIQFENLTISKRLPPTMILQKLIMLVQKLFKLSERPSLYYVNSMQPDIEIQMNDEYKDISFYSVQDGDKIFVRM